MAGRFNKVFGIFGDRGTGKTKYVTGDPELGLPGLVNLYPKLGMKVIVVDTLDHPAWRHVPIINQQQFGNFKKGIGRIIVNPEDVPPLNLFLNSHPNTNNSCIKYEDSRKHTFYKVDPGMIRLIGDSKQKNIDIGFMYHCWAHCPIDLYRYFDFIEIFKTKDGPIAREKALPGCFDEALNIHKQVMAHSSRFYHLTLNTGTE